METSHSSPPDGASTEPSELARSIARRDRRRTLLSRLAGVAVALMFLVAGFALACTAVPREPSVPEVAVLSSERPYLAALRRRRAYARGAILASAGVAGLFTGALAYQGLSARDE